MSKLHIGYKYHGYLIIKMCKRDGFTNIIRFSRQKELISLLQNNIKHNDICLKCLINAKTYFKYPEAEYLNMLEIAIENLQKKDNKK